MKVNEREHGLTLISVALILGLIAFFTLLVLKIAPIYINNSRVQSALAALQQTTDIEKKSRHEVKVLLNKRFNLNYVDRVKDSDVKITKNGNYLRVEVQYEVIENIAGNLSVLVEFDEMFEAGES